MTTSPLPIAPYSDAAYDVVVVGAGPVGLTLATLLANAGTTVAIVDPQRIVCQHPRATHLDDETMRVLQMFGAADEDRFLRHRAQLTETESGQLLVEHKMDGPRTDQGYWSDYQFHQPDFEARLRGRLATAPAAHLWLGWKGTSLTQSDDGVELVVEDVVTGEHHRIRASYLVGADGAGSWVRECTGAEVEDLHGTQTSLIVDVYPFAPSAALALDVGFMRQSSTWPVIYVPIQPPMVRFEKMLRPGDDPRDHERPENVYEFLRPWFEPGSYRIMRTSTYTWHSQLATSWRTGRVFLAGDAAHTMPPMLGQGVCSGLRDATNLAWKLSAVLAGHSPAGLLDTYESERIAHVRPYIEMSAHIANMIEQTRAVATDDAVPAAADDANPEVQVHENAQLRPSLGPGLLDVQHAAVATLAPQPTTDSGTRFDDLAGFRFAVYLDADTLAEVDDDTRREWKALDVVAVAEPSREFGEWAAARGARGVVVRPDRYIYAIAGTAADLRPITVALRDRLTADTTS